MEPPSLELVADVLTMERELYVLATDTILFITDRPDLGDVIVDVFQDIPFSLVVIPPVTVPGMDYVIDWRKTLGHKTIAWLITGASISHSPTSRRLRKELGMDVISNPGIQPDWPAVLDPANRDGCRRNADAILKALGGDVGGEFHIAAPDGTDLLLQVPALWKKELGGWEKRRGAGGLTNGVYGELSTVPYDAKGFLILRPGDFITNPINCVNRWVDMGFNDGALVQIGGGDQARQLEQLLDGAARPEYSRVVGEFSFGLNPGVPSRLFGSVVAEKLVGGVHIAVGTPLSVPADLLEAGKFRYPLDRTPGIHIDLIRFDVDVWFRPNGSAEQIPIIRDGTLVV